jgi:hypothetical protein
MVFIEYPKHGIALLVGFGKALQFQVMEPNVFIGQRMRGIVGVLCSFEYEHYLSNSKNSWCLLTKYPNEGIHFLISYTIPLHVSKDMLWSPMYF